MRGVVDYGSIYFEECVRLYLSVFNSDPINETWTLESVRKRLNEIISNPGFLGLLFLDDRVIGLALGYSEQSLNGRVFYLKELCISKEKQHMGVGSRLISSLESRSQDLGITQIRLLTWGQGQTFDFYVKNGYSTDDRLILMSKELEEAPEE